MSRLCDTALHKHWTRLPRSLVCATYSALLETVSPGALTASGMMPRLGDVVPTKLHILLIDLIGHLKKHLKRLLFPGLDLHARCRYRWLPPLFCAGPIETLDVGFGNGAFSLAA